jgi:hypothetical protein
MRERRLTALLDDCGADTSLKRVAFSVETCMRFSPLTFQQAADGNSVLQVYGSQEKACKGIAEGAAMVAAADPTVKEHALGVSKVAQAIISAGWINTLRGPGFVNRWEAFVPLQLTTW